MEVIPTGETAMPPAGGDSGVWAPARRRLTVGLVLAVTLVAFEALAIATVMPVVGRQLGDVSLYGWVFSAFMLGNLVGIVAAGTLADRVAPAGPMLAGLGLFAAGLVAGGTARSMPVLVAARAVQGIGGGVVPATAYVVISRGYPAPSHPRMFAVLSSAWVVPGLLGPAIAAAVNAAFGWRWVFLGLLPLVAIAGALAAVALRNLPAPRHEPATRPAFAVLPVAGVVAGATLTLAALDSRTAALLWIGTPVGVALLAVSLRRLTPPGTLRARPGLPATVLTRGLLTFCFFAADAYIPYLVTTVRHASTFLAGLALTAGTVAWTVGAWIQARYVRRAGPRRMVGSGLTIVLVAIGLVSLVLVHAVPAAAAVGAWAVAGFGIGIAYAPLSLTTLDRAAPGEEGRATSGLQVNDVLGQALGTGAGGVAIAAGAHGLGARSGVGLAFAIAAAAGAVALAVSTRLPDAFLRQH